jgi:glycosyltransferase involved in cell wall biosynthesis
MPLRILVLSNLDSARPFGQYLRPFHLGRGLARQGHEVGNVAVDCSGVTFGPAWSTGAKSLGRLTSLAHTARREFRPDVIYAHELRPATAALLAPGDVPVVVDLHSLPSVEWRGYVGEETGWTAALYRLAGARAGLSERLIARRADRVICAGANVAGRFTELYRPRVPTEVIVNGVERELLSDAPMAESPYAGEPGDRHAVTTLPGGVTPSNDRARRFLEAVAQELEGHSPRVTLHVLGASAPEGGSRIRYHGFQPELWPWIDHADVCMLPYPQEAALCGGPRNKLLESLARGHAVVTTEEGTRGLEEVAGWPGVHIAGDRPASFAQALRVAAGDGIVGLEERRERMLARLEWDVLAAEVGTVLAATAITSGD